MKSKIVWLFSLAGICLVLSFYEGVAADEHVFVLEPNIGTSNKQPIIWRVAQLNDDSHTGVGYSGTSPLGREQTSIICDEGEYGSFRILAVNDLLLTTSEITNRLLEKSVRSIISGTNLIPYK
jgi:hypothetical protein